MYRLCLIELEFHGECLRTLLELLRNADGVEMYVAVGEEHESLAREYLPEERLWIRGQGIDKETFLRSLWPRFNQMDGLFILTLEQHWKAYLSTCKRYPVLLRIHGLNYFKNTKPNYFGLWKTLGSKGLLGELKWQNYAYKKRVLDAVHALTPTLPIPADTGSSSSSASKWIEALPMAYNKYSFDSKLGVPFKVVIPGAVSSVKRNYKEVFEAIRSLSKNEYEWIFLGKAVDATLLQELQTLKSQGFNLKFYQDEVGWNTFDQEMLSSHLLWAPVNSAHAFKDVKEEPGITKITGSVSDALYYGKPLLMPAFYPKPHYLSTGFASYQSGDAVRCIQEIRANFVSLIPVTEGYGLKDVSAQTVNLLTQWLDSLKRS